MKPATTRRAGPLFGVGLVGAGLFAAFSPFIPVVAATYPSPGPSDAAASPADSGLVAGPTATPTATPTPDPAATPTPTPTPTSTPAPTPTPTTTPTATPTATPDPTATATPAPTAAPGMGLSVTHYWVDTEDDLGTKVTPGAMDTPPAAMDRFVVYRVRFQIVNSSDTAASVVPLLQSGAGSAPTSWIDVTAVDPIEGQPFYAASDLGRTFKVRTSALGPSAFRLASSDDPAGVAVPGIASAGVNPMATLLLPAHSFTELQFSVRATVAADWAATYAFRLGLGATTVADTLALATMRATPVFTLPPGATTGTPVHETLVQYPLSRISASPFKGSPTYQLNPPAFVSPHGEYTLTSDACASCHATHVASGPNLRDQPTMSALCFTCHDGTGSTYDVKAQWTSGSLPANDSSQDLWYSHPATGASTHSSDRSTEFAGVLNRHAQCADCHQPHATSGVRPVAQAGGWSAAGAIAGAAGVAVVNGAAGAPPVSYTLASTSSLEYQLCFKCHSGYTQLTAQDPLHPSRWSLDKAIELNPANVSYHPIEAAGKNTDPWMQASLQGAATGKLWAFNTTDVIRCENCHGTSSAASPAVDARVDNHASQNRGILLRNYRDRTLEPSGVAYLSNDFALCYLCHAETPMIDTSGNLLPTSNFEFHGKHLAGILGVGSGSTDIDVAGGGQGNAVCAECHFRIHGDALAVNGQTPAPGLVNFAPDVQPYNGVLNFVKATSTTYGSCTLTCHSKAHNGMQY